MEPIKEIGQKLHIPGALSLASLLLSWLAITLLLSGSLGLSVAVAVGAFLLDATDGYSARTLGRVSNFGRQLDGMADLINYSLLAALVIWQELLPGPLGVAVGYLVIATGILRLITFNEEGYIRKKGVLYYRGVTTCHLSLIAFLFLVITNVVFIPPLLIALIISVFAVLQLSNLKTRKTGALLFWVPVSLLIAIGGLVWL
jgi:CDP-diacylglycerol---serine O-phosphatidyltransferase